MLRGPVGGDQKRERLEAAEQAQRGEDSVNESLQAILGYQVPHAKQGKDFQRHSSKQEGLR